MNLATATTGMDLAVRGGVLGSPRLLAGPGRDITESLAPHLDRLGDPLGAVGTTSPRELIQRIRASGLRGRGGGGFPVGEKLAAVAAGAGVGNRAIVVANASESEPASAKDRFLLSVRPHLVIDGIEVAARAVGARQAYICVSQRSEQAVFALRQALLERREARLLPVPVEVVLAAPTFVGGDETALLSWIAGGAPSPTVVPPLPAHKGLTGHPTLVQNAESLAHLALIARFGPDWFRRVGTEEEPGTMLVTVSGCVTSAGVYETPIGANLEDILEASGWSVETEVILVGGYFGSWVSRQDAGVKALSRASLASCGASPGAGVILAMPKTACGVKETAEVVDWLAAESSGQCGPCVHGLSAVAACLTRLASPASARRADLGRLLRWCTEIEGRGACRHPDGVIKLVRSCLQVFGPEVEAHRSGRCFGSYEGWLPLPATTQQVR
ncbi:MAG TPA: NADH-ubiquinone oxidoreductase-F iron-sulfur binding region domain-containing protein [Candidatus Dormibacteraeota bacterium]|nr:NADH-ubiquinone oxidoreductase-F iron-sulfur binding region domain-containing protein [Candidatus Dormibacteraeota bacterium]